MPNSIVTNTAANTALRYMYLNQMATSGSLAKLSSGSRIVKASDDAASLAVGTKLKADVTALKQAAINASHASSVLQVADGGMARISDILQRMKSLAVQASSGSLSDNERGFLDKEYQALLNQIDDIADQTRFNGQSLIDGSLGTTVTLGAGWDTTGAGSRGMAVRVIGEVDTGADTDAIFRISYDANETNGVGTFTLTMAGNDDTIGNADDRTFTATIDISNTGPDNVVLYSGTIEFEEAGIALDLTDFVARTATAGAADLAAGANTEFTVTQSGQLSFQVGVDVTSDKVTFSLDDMRTSALGIAGTGVDTQAKAQTANGNLDAAIKTVNAARAKVGALMSRFEFVQANLQTSIENMDAARSVLMDTDVAAEMSKFASAQVLMQANVSMLAQANQLPQNLLKLLQ